MEHKSKDISMLRQHLLEEKYDLLLELARQKIRILSLLTALTYDEDTIVVTARHQRLISIDLLRLI